MSKKILSSSQGVALLMVLTSITILTTLLAEFTFDTHINKIKSHNVQDVTKSRHNAESGLAMAMARLRLYKEAKNQIEKNDKVKKFIKPEVLNLIWSQPFIYPIPVLDSFNIIQKDSITKFEENSVIEGELQVTIQSISQRLNLNLLRLQSLVRSYNQRFQKKQEEIKPQDFISNFEKSLTELLSEAVEKKKEDDENFAERYGDLRPEILIKTIKYYINDKNSYEEAETSEIEALFADLDITPKHAPMNTLEEIYLLPGWDDELVELIRDSITVHGSLNLDLNTLTDQGLKLIFPNLEEEQIKEFFEFRDDPEDPQHFSQLEDFKKFFVETTGFIDEEDFDQRINEFAQAGVNFGTQATLFRVHSTGKYGRASYSLAAYVTIPVQPLSAPTPPQESAPPDATTAQTASDPETAQDQASPSGTQQQPAKEPLQFLEPRIVEIIPF